MAAIAEPFFEMGARVEMQPVMNFEDLKKGLSADEVKNFFLFFISENHSVTPYDNYAPAVEIYLFLLCCCNHVVEVKV